MFICRAKSSRSGDLCFFNGEWEVALALYFKEGLSGSLVGTGSSRALRYLAAMSLTGETIE